MSQSTGIRGAVLYLVVCAAPPAGEIHELLELLQRVGWTVQVIATPQALDWLDAEALERKAGHPVRYDYRREREKLPPAHTIAVVPATFNTINKWAAGISDTFALGILNEAIGLGVRVLAVPYSKPSLAAHPMFGESLKRLTSWGVTVLPNEIIRPKEKGQPFEWGPVVDEVGEYHDWEH